MSFSGINKPLVVLDLSFTDEQICLVLEDQREIRVPLSFYPKLEKAKPEQRANFKFIGEGTGIHWPDLDEDLSVESIVEGRRSVG